MTEGCYYRSRHPQIREWFDEVNHRRAAYHAAIEALHEEYPGYEVVEMRLGLGGGLRYVAGLHGERAPGPFWLRKKGDTFWSPDRRNRPGRNLFERLQAIELRLPSLPGMPAVCFHAERHVAQSPGFEPIDGAFWISWGMPRAAVETEGRVDLELWEPARASEYWLAKEATAAVPETQETTP